MTLEEQIEQALLGALDAEHIHIENESHKHKGHSGDDGSGETHFKLIVVSSAFDGLSRVQRHRLITKILHDPLKKIHALSMETLTPLEKSSNE